MLSGFLGAGEHGMQGLFSFYPEHVWQKAPKGVAEAEPEADDVSVQLLLPWSSCHSVGRIQTCILAAGSHLTW